jgi:hypothetical protein
MLHICTEMRSGQYAAPREDADAGKGRQELWPLVCYQRPGGLTLMRVEAALRARSKSLGPTVRQGGDLRLQTSSRRL